jgi:hypothetical protein
MWYASRDFNSPNLNVKRGDKLPKSWCYVSAREYLQKEYGEDCITNDLSKINQKAETKQVNKKTEPVKKKQKNGGDLPRGV